MTHKFKAIFLAGLAATLMAMPAAQAQPRTQDDARIARAIQDYAARTAQEANAARDARVASRIGALADNPGSPVLGNPKGDVTIVEFFDYACPYCKAVHPRLLALVNADRRIKLVLKEFPILTPESMIASRMALAAAKQGKYRPFHLALMHSLGQLREADIVATARASGLDIARLRKDMYAPDVTDEIIANFNLARATRTFQTPTFIIGSHVLTSDSADINFAAEVARARAGRR